MTTQSTTVYLPNLMWQADADEVEGAAFLSGHAEGVEFDLEHHLATISYSGENGLEDILMWLAEAGYPVAQA